MSFEEKPTAAEIVEIIHKLECSRDLARKNDLVFLDYMITVILLECNEIYDDLVGEFVVGGAV